MGERRVVDIEDLGLNFGSGIATVATAVVCVGAVLAAFAPVHSYEVSWIRATPVGTWIAIALGWAAFVVLLLRREYPWAAWVGGICALAVGLLPFLQEYFSFGRTDPLTYYAMAKYLASKGTSWQDDLYPALQGFIVQLSFHARLPIREVLPLWSVIQYGAWVAAIWLGASAWGFTTLQRALATAVGTIPILTQFHFAYYPNGYGILLFMLLAVIWLGRTSIETTILFAIVMLVLPYAHPTVAILAVALFLALFMASRALRWWGGHRFGRVLVEAPFLPLVSLVMLLGWLVNFRQIQLSIRRTFGIAEIRAQSQGISIAGQLLGAHPDLWKAVLGVVLLVGTSTILALLVLVGWLSVGRQSPQRSRAAPLILASMLFFIASLLLLVSPNLGQHVVFLRIVTLPYPLLFAPWLVAILLPSAVDPRLIAIMIGAAMAIALLAVFPSPLEFQPNDQVTMTDISALEWVDGHGYPFRTTTTLASQLYRFIDGGRGIDARESKASQFAHGDIPFATAPVHFGEPLPLSTALGHGRFVVILTFDADAYQGPWAGTEKWTSADFATVADVPGNSKVYDSGTTSVLLT